MQQQDPQGYTSGTDNLVFVKSDLLQKVQQIYYTDARVDARINGTWLVDEDNMAR